MEPLMVHLVDGLEHFLFFHILGIFIQQLTFIFFRGVGSTTNQSLFLPSGVINYGKAEKITIFHHPFLDDMSNKFSMIVHCYNSWGPPVMLDGL